jgi:hypothetical protein
MHFIALSGQSPAADKGMPDSTLTFVQRGVCENVVAAQSGWHIRSRPLMDL